METIIDEGFLQDFFWTYRGQVLQNKRHGYGVDMGKDRTFAAGLSYKGEFADGKRHGRGTLVEVNCEGSWARGRIPNRFHGRGAHWAGGARCFEGDWVEGCAVQGTMLDCDGSAYLVDFKDGTLVFELKGDWHAAARRCVAAGRLEGWPVAAAEWEGAWARDGRRFEGTLRGLCPVLGVEMDVGSGKRFAVTYSGDVTIGENPMPVRICFFCII